MIKFGRYGSGYEKPHIRYSENILKKIYRKSEWDAGPNVTGRDDMDDGKSSKEK